MRNRIIFIYYILFLAGFFGAVPVFAADDDSGNHLSIGLGYRTSQSLFKGDESGSALYLSGRYQWRGLFIEIPSAPRRAESRPTLGYNFFNTQHWLLDAVYIWMDGDVRLKGTVDGEDVDFDREQSESFGVRATGGYGDTTLQLALLPFNNEAYDRGTYASAHIARSWQVSNWTLRGVLGAQYRSKEVMNYYFGVDSSEATLLFPEYTAGGGTRFSMQLEALYPLTQNVVLSGWLGHTEFSDSAKNSPIIQFLEDFDDRPNNASEVGISLSYVF